MTARIEGPGKPLTNDDLADLERTLRAALPSQYRGFLLRNNGGIPSPDTVDVDGVPGSPTDVQVFFGIGRPVESSDLSWNRQTFSDRLPDRMLPIACDSGGNLFCLSLSGEDAGSVIYVDLEQRQPAFYLAAEGFDAFLGKLSE